MKHSTALPATWIVLRYLIVLNWIGGACVLALLAATLVAREWTFTALGIGPADQIRFTIAGLQLIAALGLIGVPINHAILTRLVKLVETVRGGDPFVADNAYRLNAIAWFLLALQVLSIVIAAVGMAVSRQGIELHLDAGFSVPGWLAVVLTFVLARVFAEGTLMREDLEGTI
ncbi:DUF2975 domain-containing protein [Sphingomonas daechungensis]|uniref:DUF2975 domain-containing protein n=1 Tax=Sphingomonas daechungensis TaxID=1176646 RepID=UPI003783D6D9